MIDQPALAPMKLAGDLRQLAGRADIRTIPCEVLCWDLDSDTLRLPNWEAQRGYLESLARTIEGVGGSSQHSRFGDNDVYQHAVSCSLSAIARFGSLVPLLRLVNVTVNSCSVPVDQAVLERVVGLALELETIEVELLRLYQSQVAATDADGRNQGAGFALGERSAHLGSEALVEAAAQRLHDRGLVDVDGEPPLDFSRRYLAPRALTELGRLTISLLSRPVTADNCPAI